MIIDGIEYTVLQIKDELKSRWEDGRPWIQEFYELQDEADEFSFLTVWSDGHFELADVPISTTPMATGDISEIRGDKLKKKPRFNYMYKFEGEKEWRDVSENFLRILIKEFFTEEDIDRKILDIKFGYPLKIREATIEAWPNEREN